MAAQIDPIYDDIRQYLRLHGEVIRDEFSRGNYHVFVVDVHGTHRELKVHNNALRFPDTMTRLLEDSDIVRKLESGDQEIIELLR